MRKKLVVLLTLAFSVMPLATTQAQAGEVCNSAVIIAEKYGIFPIYGDYGEIGSALGLVCSVTP